MSRRRFTLPTLIVACSGASLFSFWVGKQQRGTIPLSVLESWISAPTPVNTGSQKVQFVWYSSTEDGGRCLSEEAETHCVADEDDDDIDSDGDEVADDDDDESENTPYHLTMSLRDVSSDLIESKQALFNRMHEIKDEFELPFIAHGCRALANESMIRCFGILNEGQMSLYAWPKKSALIFELFSADREISIGDINLFSRILQQTNSFEENERVNLDKIFPWTNFTLGAESRWTIRQRGDRDATTDYDVYMEYASDIKEPVTSIQSKFQRIDIVDFYSTDSLDTLVDGIKKDKDYVVKNPEFFKPDRTLFLDGVVQSTREGNAAYHESLVQPAMFAHDNPKRVAIIGGGECATLREVLKHNTIDKVFMIEIDEVIVEASKQFLPDWNDCSNFEGSSRYCMDDERAEVMHEDAFKWFIDRFGANPIVEEEDPFDVIILDALDPQNVVDFAEALYADGAFMSALYNGLSEDGILVSQVGQALSLDEPAQTYSVNKNRVSFIDSLAEQGFISIVEYNEGHAMFEASWTFNVAFKSMSSRNNWDDNEAAVMLKMKKRAIRTLDRKSPFDYFDGADMQARLPSKASEVVFCRQVPTPGGCEGGHGFDPFKPNIILQDVARNSTPLGDFDDEHGEAYVLLEETVQQLSIGEKAKALLSKYPLRHEIPAHSSLLHLDVLQHSYPAGKKRHLFKVVDGTSDNSAEALLSDDNTNSIVEATHKSNNSSYVYNPAFARNPSPDMINTARFRIFSNKKTSEEESMGV